MKTTIFKTGFLICFIFLSSESFCQSTNPVVKPEMENRLIGIWGMDQVFGPVIKGEVTIDTRDSIWIAGISGYKIHVNHISNSINFALPDNLGEFRGTMDNSSKKIFGHWIQPAGAAQYIFKRTSPVELSMIEKNIWRGLVYSFR